MSSSLVGCSFLFAFEEYDREYSATSAEDGGFEASMSDTSSGARDATVVDGADGTDPDAYYDIADRSRWSIVDLGPLVSVGQSYAGGVFDGRFVTLAPGYGG